MKIIKVLQFLTAITFTTMTVSAVNMWPDTVVPPIQLDEASQLAKQRIRSAGLDRVYCLNATLLNGEDNSTDMGYWSFLFVNERGQNHSVAVRMDGLVSNPKKRPVQINTPNPWPLSVTPPISMESGLSRAKRLLTKESDKPYHCLNATLVTGSDDVVNDGMWNFVFQTPSNNPIHVNIRMNGKSKVNEIQAISPQ